MVSEVLMCRQGHRGAFLLLEGPDDSRFWEPAVHPNPVRNCHRGRQTDGRFAIRDPIGWQSTARSDWSMTTVRPPAVLAAIPNLIAQPMRVT